MLKCLYVRRRKSALIGAHWDMKVRWKMLNECYWLTGIPSIKGVAFSRGLSSYLAKKGIRYLEHEPKILRSDDSNTSTATSVQYPCR